ncbi:PAS domain-containing protein [Parvularcula sp. ZS-1/3]|uniref:histidine kinase n=1 Tax=Parvularcula mediterranea TaxID=2732508 RepID=A0A7Y3RL45_9PROT|nr:ATP-binding protein [Parvularcula mediterranea]NNU16000.1 PAS domain-containing protein [Parvularcula mediterranea]
MDVQRNSVNVKPPTAEGRAPLRRNDLLVAAGAIAAGLAAALIAGVLKPLGALLAGGIAGTVLLLRWLVPTPQQVFAPLSEEATEEVERLQRYSILLDALPQPVMLLDAQDRIETANAACFRMFGEGIEGANIAGIIRAPAALGALREARHMDGAQEAEISITGPNTLSALFYVSPLEHDEAEGEMIVMIRDRTEQRQLERMRTDFIANAGHELRTPLASLLGFIETLQGHAKDDPDARAHFLKIMQAQTERMQRLVRDLVSLSALELNERRLPEDDVDLCEIAAVVREMMAPVAERANGEIVPGPSNCSIRMIGDRDQLIQVAQNLIDNALKYGATGSTDRARVHVTVGSGPDHAFEAASSSGDSPDQIAVRAGCAPSDLVYIRVRDEGGGIARTDLPRLTERFYRTDVDKSHPQGGTGLGLAIVKHIVGRHRGGILVESAQGEGAAFTCYFPPRPGPESDLPAGH